MGAGATSSPSDEHTCGSRIVPALPLDLKLTGGAGAHLGNREDADSVVGATLDLEPLRAVGL
jgi:hypothetical protein